MAITIETVRAVMAAGKASAEAFDAALEQAGDETADELAGAAEECGADYEAAVDHLLADDLAAARESLLDAMSLEGHWTRYDTARAALVAVEAAQ